MSSLTKKALFVLSTIPQAQMFQQLTNDLENFDCKFISVNKYIKDSPIENFFKNNNLNYEFLNGYSEEIIHNIINQEKPDIVITGNDQTLILDMFLRIANSKEIPTLTIQDGILVETEVGKNKTKTNLIQIPIKTLKLLFNPNLGLKDKKDILKSSFNYRRDVSQVYGQGHSSKLAVFGENTRQKFINEGVDPEKIVITGNPRFDELIAFDAEKEDLKGKMNIPLEKKVILITTQYFYEIGMWTAAQREEFITQIALNVKKIENLYLIIKLHPSRENKKDYQDILDKLDMEYQIYQHENLLDLLAVADVVITVSSTSGLEALALNKPLVLVNLFEDNHPSFFNNSGALFVQNKENLLDSIKTALKGLDKEKTEKFIYNNLYRLDGHSSQRIAKLIMEMTNDT